jgi:hypothetical protein
MFESLEIDFVIFRVMPYAALTVFLVDSVARYGRDGFTWKSSSSQLLRRRQLIRGSILFHAGILTMFFGLLAGLFTPVWVLDALGIPYGPKQWMAVLIGGPAGLAALIGGTMLIHPRLGDGGGRALAVQAAHLPRPEYHHPVPFHAAGAHLVGVRGTLPLSAGPVRLSDRAVAPPPPVGRRPPRP